VATTAILGLAAVRKGLIPTTGLVTELPALRGAGLIDWDQLVVGGHEVRPGNLADTAAALGLPAELISACRDDLDAAQLRIRPGVLCHSGPAIEELVAEELADEDCTRSFATPSEAIAAIAGDLQDFRQAEGLDHVVVVLLASTEPPTDTAALPESWPELEATLDEPLDDSQGGGTGCPLRAGSLYAIAALDSKNSFVNFTPSLGSSYAALDDLARRRGACHAGRDGKTGETLLKTVLAPLFASRNLEVMSWVGHNILGNADGRVLASPEHKASKLKSKDGALGALLGYEAQTLVSIEYVASLGERKTAWNHVHFRGFLGAPMTLQLTWDGHDSALAAPLVLDLARLVAASAARGETGALGALACFFKEPLGRPIEGHQTQFDALVRHYA
jgi:myo-inositol-1-phosphate synthase